MSAECWPVRLPGRSGSFCQRCGVRWPCLLVHEAVRSEPRYKRGDAVVLRKQGGSNRREYQVEYAPTWSTATGQWLYPLRSQRGPDDKRRTAYEHDLIQVQV